MADQTDRGEYRSIRTVMLDGPDFRRLSAEARQTLVFARLSLGATALAAIPGFLYAMAERTGLSIERQRDAWQEIEANGWAFYDGTVAWIVRGFEFEPGLHINDPKHRKNVQTFIAALPRTSLVGAFVDRYRDWWRDEPGESPPPEFPRPDRRLLAFLGQLENATTSTLEAPSQGQRRPFVAVESREERVESRTTPTTTARARVENGVDNRAAAEVQLRQALDERHHEALDDLLRASRNRSGVVRVLWAYVNPHDGTQAPGGKPVPPDLVGRAIVELLASKDPAFNAAFFKGIVLRLQRGDSPSSGDGATTDLAASVERGMRRAREMRARAEA